MNIFSRFLSPESTEAYFKLGSKPVGKFVSTTATLVDSELACFKPIIDILQVSVMQGGGGGGRTFIPGGITFLNF